MNETLRSNAMSTYHRLQGIEEWLGEAKDDVSEELRARMTALAKELNEVICSNNVLLHDDRVPKISNQVRDLYREVEVETQIAI